VLEEHIWVEVHLLSQHWACIAHREFPELALVDLALADLVLVPVLVPVVICIYQTRGIHRWCRIVLEEHIWVEVHLLSQHWACIARREFLAPVDLVLVQELVLVLVPVWPYMP
jgi:hypothetical protein